MDEKNLIKADLNQNKPSIKFLAYKVGEIIDSNIEPNKTQSINKFSPYFFICNMCNKKFTKLSNLKRHILQVEYSQTKKCEFCGFDFKKIEEHLKTYKKK